MFFNVVSFHYAQLSMHIRRLFSSIILPVGIASLCCLSPVILVLLGFSSISFASSLADTLYGDYKWVFRIAGLCALTLSIVLYFRRSGVCTLDAAKRHRREIFNTVLLAVIGAVLGYMFFLYVVVHYVGVWLHIWS